MDLVEQYNRRLLTLEDGTIKLLNRVLDSSFNRLVRRARIQIKAGSTDTARRNLALLQEFKQLVPAYRPDKVDAFDRVLRNLMTTAGQYGLTVAETLTTQMTPERERLSVSIPIDATASAAAQARGYLRRHGEKFAETAAFTVAQGIAEGRPTSAMVQDMRQRLSVTKSRAQTIVRTESLRAYNEASNRYYATQGVDVVLYYATADDRACPWCAPRAGRIYRREDIKVPLHPRCRCYLAPWDPEIAEINPEYEATRIKHREEVEKALQRTGTPEPANLNKAAVFEQLVPQPIL